MDDSKNLISKPGPSVIFERGVAGNMIAIDGTWKRACTMKSVSQRGATLSIDGSIEGLGVKEFFLSLSVFGSVYRRCELEQVNGSEIGVVFLRGVRKTKQ